MVTVKPFKGPLTALEISNWFRRCEDVFDDWIEDNGKTLEIKRRIHVAGNAISTDPPTDKLARWWTENITRLEKLSWDGFRDEVKEKALGKGWRLRALKDFYTTAQGAMTVDDYFDNLKGMQFVVSRIGGRVPDIDPFVLKCHLLFQATPSITEQAIHDASDKSFIDADENDIKDWLSKYRSGANSSPSTDSQPTKPVTEMWMLSAQSGGGVIESAFNDVLSYATNPSSLGRVTKVTVWSNGNSTKPTIQRYEFQFTGPALTVYNPPSAPSNTQSSAIDLDADEYIASCRISYTYQTFASTSGYNITSVYLTTSKGDRNLFIGVRTGSEVTFTPPAGLRIVGFHGSAFSGLLYDNSIYNYPIRRLGVICAPVTK